MDQMHFNIVILNCFNRPNFIFSFKPVNKFNLIYVINIYVYSDLYVHIILVCNTVLRIKNKKKHTMKKSV